jgi:hypothetical protein
MHSILFFECLVREESMTKNNDFGQNRQNRSTSNGCRIAGTHNEFRFFFCLKYSVTIVEQKKNSIWKVSYGSHPLKKFPSDHGEMVTRNAGPGRVQTIKKFSLNSKITILDHF